MTRIENPPAFPHHEVWDDDKPEIGWIGGGMTLRDYFAAKAALGIISSPRPTSLSEGVVCLTFTNIAKAAYLLADAMLEERLK